MEPFIFIISLAVLAKFSILVVNAAAELSQTTGISRTFIGFIFVGLATSLPEFSIGIISSIENMGEISVGNLLGANITNLTLILGVMAFIGFNMGKIYSRQIMDAALAVAGICLMLVLIGGAGLIFGVFLLCVYYIFSSSVMKHGFVSGDVVSTPQAAKTAAKLVLFVAVVVISSYVITDSAVLLASDLGIPAAIIGATIISVGTTLPEMSVNIAAVMKRNISLAIGDTTGTVVSNISMILGTVVLINPVAVSADIAALALALAAVSGVVYFMANRQVFGMKESAILVSIYAAYMFYFVTHGAL